MPPEDTCGFHDNAFVVADGITRDPKKPKDFTGLTVEKLLQYYPKPSGAALAAQIFARSFLASVQKKKQPSIESIQEAFLRGNLGIRRLNTKSLRHIDFLVNDFYGTVACGGVIKDMKLYWGVVADCRIAVFDRHARLRHRTPNDMVPVENYVNKIRKLDWNLAKTRRWVRKTLRNNPHFMSTGRRISYGALTGEDAVKDFVHTGVIELRKGDVVIAYSDGFEPFVQRTDFRNLLFLPETHLKNALDKICAKLEKKEKYSKEKTCIIYQP